MKKKLYFLLLMLLCTTIAFAQVCVQGVPRNLHKNAKGITRSVNASVDFDKIQYWVGTGDKKSALVVKWNDGKDDNKCLVWGYRWNEKTTGAQMLLAVAAADPRFYLLVNGGTQYGVAIGGYGFDLNDNGNILLVNGNHTFELTDGVYNCGSYSFDDFTSNDNEDHWQSGWSKGYWSYWVASADGHEFTYSNVGASSRELADGSIDGWSFVTDMSNFDSADMSGDLEYVTTPTKKADYTKGTFIVNEDWYGHQNSTVNFLTNDGEWVYRVVQKENPGIELGCTAQYGQIYGDKFYVMSKQEKDPGASVVGGRVNILDAKTMKMEKQIQTISTNADGRAFLGVDEHKGYVGTSNGIFILNLDKQEIAGSIEETTNGGGSAYGQLYSGQVGSMVRVNDRVFAVHQKYGLLVIDANTDKVKQVIASPEGWGFGSVVLSKDGNLWLSLADKSGSGQADNRIVKLNPNTLEQTIIVLPEGIYGPANSWYAWTPDCFCASNQQNVLYWNGGSSSWFSNYTIYKYDIDNNKFSKYLDYSNAADGFYIYGCSFRIDPVSDDAYVSLFKGFGDRTYVVRKYDAEGKQLAEYPMISNYWCPSLPVFPDNEAPVIANPVGDLTLAADKTATIDLKDLATDADNFDAAIVKSVKTVSDVAVLDAKMQNGSLIITPKKEGEAAVTIKVNSNGKLAETTFVVTVTPATGIKNITTNGAVEVARFSADGKRISAPQKGLNIIRMSDGSTRKVVVK